MPILAKTPPSWIYPGAMYDLDFANNRYWSKSGGAMWLGTGQGTGVQNSAASFLFEANGGGAAGSYYTPDTNGLWITGPVTSLRRTGYGLWIEGSPWGSTAGSFSTNYALWCRDLTNAVWTAVTATVTKNQTGADGVANSATSITATSPAATVLQTISALPQSAQLVAIQSGGMATYAVNNILTVVGGTGTAATLKVTAVSSGVITGISVNSGGVYTVLPTNPVSITGGGGTLATFNLTFIPYQTSALVKRLSGTSAISMTLDGITYTAITSSINTNSFSQVTIPTQALTAGVVGFKIASSSDSIAVDFVQVENNDVATSPIFTTTTSINRAPEETFMLGDATFSPFNAGQNIINNIDSGHPASVLIAYSGNFSSNGFHNIYGDSPSAILFLGAANGTNTVRVQNNGSQIATSTNTENLGLFNLNKVFGRLTGVPSTDGGGISICLNGGPITTVTGTFSPIQSTVNHGGFGNRGAGDRPLNGYIKRFTAWPTEMTNGQMIQYSTVTNNS